MNYARYLGEETIAIFLLHGVVDAPPHPVRNYTRKHLPLDDFATFLRELIAAGGQPLSVEELLAYHSFRRAIPARSFAITFDDGFQNNLTIAAPVLAGMRVPATFYLTTGFVAQNRMSWIDRIEYALEPAPPGQVRFLWGIEPFSDDASKRALLDVVRRQIKSDPTFDADTLATDVQVQLGLTPTWSSDDPLDRKLTWPEVRELGADPLFTIGGHTHTHSIMSFLGDVRLSEEIDISRDLLAREAGVSIRHYSYPEGLAHCYSDRVIEALRARGVVCCPTAEHGINTVDTDPFLLKRITVT